MSSALKSRVEFFKPLENTIKSLIKEFDTIPNDRKKILKQLTEFVEVKNNKNEKIDLIFILRIIPVEVIFRKSGRKPLTHITVSTTL